MSSVLSHCTKQNCFAFIPFSLPMGESYALAGQCEEHCRNTRAHLRNRTSRSISDSTCAFWFLSRVGVSCQEAASHVRTDRKYLTSPSPAGLYPGANRISVSKALDGILRNNELSDRPLSFPRLRAICSPVYFRGKSPHRKWSSM